MLYFVSSIIAVTIHFKVPCSTHFQLVPYRNGYKVTIQLHVSNALLSRVTDTQICILITQFQRVLNESDPVKMFIK